MPLFPTTYEEVRLRNITKEDLEGLSYGEKLKTILTSIQFVIFNTITIIVNFFVLSVGQILAREHFKYNTENTKFKVAFLSMTWLTFIINIMFMIEISLQVTVGFGFKYLKHTWGAFDSVLVLLLFVVEVVTRALQKDPLASIWQFLVLFRLARVLAMMSQHTDLIIREKKDERLKLEEDIENVKLKMEEEDSKNIKLKDDLEIISEELGKLEVSLDFSRENAQSLMRRYSMS